METVETGRQDCLNTVPFEQYPKNGRSSLMMVIAPKKKKSKTPGNARPCGILFNAICVYMNMAKSEDEDQKKCCKRFKATGNGISKACFKSQS